MYGSGAYCGLALSAMVDILARSSGSNNVDCSGPQCLAAKVSRRIRLPGLILRTVSGRDRPLVLGWSWSDIAGNSGPRCASAIVHSTFDGPGWILRTALVRDARPQSIILSTGQTFTWI